MGYSLGLKSIISLNKKVKRKKKEKEKRKEEDSISLVR